MKSDAPEPIFDVTKLKTSMLSVENWLPLKQEWIDLLDAKLKSTHTRFEMAVAEHNKEVNPSGVPFKGRKRQAPVTGHPDEIPDESDAITVTPVDITIEALAPDQRAQGNTKQHTPHELMSKNGKPAEWPSPHCSPDLNYDFSQQKVRDHFVSHVARPWQQPQMSRASGSTTPIGCPAMTCATRSTTCTSAPAIWRPRSGFSTGL